MLLLQCYNKSVAKALMLWLTHGKQTTLLTPRLKLHPVLNGFSQCLV